MTPYKVHMTGKEMQIVSHYPARIHEERYRHNLPEKYAGRNCRLVFKNLHLAHFYCGRLY